MKKITWIFGMVLSGCLLLPSAVLATDLSIYGVIKQQGYVQDNPLVPHLNTNGGSNNNGSNGGSNNNSNNNSPLTFNLFFNANSPGDNPTSASVQLPGGTVDTAVNNGGNGIQFNDTSYTDKLDWDTAYPAGTYTVTMSLPHDGNKTIPLTMPGDTYTAIPFISNYSAAQSVVAANPFTVYFTAAGTAIHVELQVNDNNGNQVFQDSSLTAASTSVLIPGGTLQAGMKYTATLMFVNGNYDVASYSGATGVAAYSRQTSFTIVTTGGSDTDSPYLVATSPNYGDTGITVNSLIAFEFSEPMQSGVSINWTNVTAANFTYTWSLDKTTLFCQYSTSLPQNTVISWQLNGGGFHDLGGNSLQGNPNNGNYNTSTPSGSFTTANQAAAATDVNLFGLVKIETAVQKSSSAPVLDGGFQMNAFVDFTGVNTVTNSSLSWSLGTVTNTYDVQNSSDQISISANFLLKADFDYYFHSGVYTILVDAAHDGAKSVSLSLPADNYPGLPTVSNYTAAQAVNPTNAFTLTWTGFAGGTTNDLIAVEIKHPVTGNTVFKIDPTSGVLNGTATQVTIPVGIMAPGRTYKAKLTFVKIATQTIVNYSGTTAMVGYGVQTSFKLTTTGTSLKPGLKAIGFDPVTKNFTLRLQGERQMQYTIDRIFDIGTTNWSSTMTLNANNPTNTFEGTIDFTDGGIIQNTSRQFYRAREGY